MIAETRRSLLKLIGFSPAAAIAAKAELSGMVAGPVGTALMAAAAVPQTLPSGYPVSTAEKLIGRSAMKKLWALLRQSEGDQIRRGLTRSNGLDGDIAALKSTSRTYKELRQRERDSAEAWFLDQVREWTN